MINSKRMIKSHRFKRFCESLEKLYDSRVKGKIKHKLSDCLIIIILASLSGCNIFREQLSFAKRYENKLKGILNLNNGIPSHDTLERIIHKIRHSELENVLIDAKKAWISSELKQGRDIPEPIYDGDFSGQFKLRIPKSLHKQLA